MAVRDDPPGGELVSRPAGYLFGQNVARVAFRRGSYLREFNTTAHFGFVVSYRD
jgi:LysR family cys regulon transcriptional activator